jgi:fatty-acyl-CoA synthase
MTLPTRNSQLPCAAPIFGSVPEMLDYAARGETGVTFYSVRGEILSAWPWREIASAPRSRPAA